MIFSRVWFSTYKIVQIWFRDVKSFVTCITLHAVEYPGEKNVYP